MGNYESRRRTKPCASCKQRRLKCQYRETLPCERCIKHGIACFYPSGDLRVRAQSSSSFVPNSIEPLGCTQQPVMPLLAIPQTCPSPQTGRQAQTTTPSKACKNPNMVSLVSDDNVWKNSVDQRLETVRSAIDSVVTICRNNNIEHEHQIAVLQAQLQEQRQEITRLRCNASTRWKPPSTSITTQNGTSSVELPPLSALISNDSCFTGTPFNVHDVLSIDECKILIQIFMENMVQHMLGYQLENLSARELCYQCPILLLSICAVACPHHPNLASKQRQLIAGLKWHCSSLLHDYETIYKPPQVVERTILALIIATLWLESDQMFMSVALHLARTWRIDRRHNNELWRLWCLLYITDGTQNLVSRKSPSIYKQLEPIIKSVREYLVAHIEDSELKKVLKENGNPSKIEVATNKQLLLLNEVEMEKIKVIEPQFQDIKLCGLVEYHMAIESLFHDKYENNGSIEGAVGLLRPANLGIPWENNLDLDKWMVTWTIALQNIDLQQDAWCLKSTLLYYNFARMHINTNWMLKRESTLNNWLEVWKSRSTSNANILRDASKEVSLSAATSLLKLATRDRDISARFKYLPNHVYVMLFFASMIVLKYPVSIDRFQKAEIEKLRQGYGLVRDFKQMLEQSSSSNREFVLRIISNLKVLMNTFIQECIIRIKAPPNESSVEEIINKRDESTDPHNKQKSILAWPSVNHGHP